jgi:uncharacterized phage protein gp47/JayE
MSSLFPTASELFRVGRRAIVQTPGTKINPAVVDVPGSNVNIAVGTSAVLGQEIVSRGASAMRGAFIDSARGSQLDRVVFDRTGLLRFSATASTVDLVLQRPTSGAGAGVYSAGSRIQTPTGVQFGLNADATFGATDLVVDVSATALVVGEAGNVESGSITQFSDQPFDSTLTVTNPAGAAGGTETETDIQLIGRVRGFFPTLRRGILSAIQFGALQVDGVAVATATEIINPSSGFPAAAVQLVVGDRNGNASGPMLQAVADELLEFRAAGIFVQVLGGQVVNQAVQWQLGFLSGFDETLATSRVSAVCVALGQFLPPGPATGTLYRSSLIAAARSVPGVVVSDNSLIAPAGDVVPATPQTMLRILPTQVTFG